MIQMPRRPKGLVVRDIWLVDTQSLIWHALSCLNCSISENGMMTANDSPTTERLALVFPHRLDQAIKLWRKQRWKFCRNHRSDVGHVLILNLTIN